MAIPAHTYCIACGYNLAGLSDEGDCPECATPAYRSVGRALAATGEPAMRRLRAAVVSAVAGTLAPMGAAAVLLYDRSLLSLALAIYGASIFAWCHGARAVARVEAARRPVAPRDEHLAVAQWCVVLNWAWIVLGVLAWIGLRTQMAASGALIGSAAVFVLAQAVALAALWAMTFRSVARLAGEMGGRPLAAAARGVSQAPAVFAVGLVGIGVAATVAEHMLPHRGISVLYALPATGVLALLGGAAVLARFHRLLGERLAGDR